MDLKELIIPFVWWTATPKHRISCASALDPIGGDCISHLVTGSVTGEIVLWRRYNANPESPGADRQNGYHTAIEKNIHLQVAEMRAAASSNAAGSFIPCAVVIGRKQSGIAVSAVETFQFRDTALFVVCYVDGLICIHECLSGDNLLSLPLLTMSVSKIRVYQNLKGDPFVMAACIPQRISTQVLIIRIGLGEGYHGSMSIVKTLDLEVPVIDAEIHVQTKHLLVLTRMQLVAFNLLYLGDPVIVIDLSKLSAPLGLSIYGSNAIVFGKKGLLSIEIHTDGKMVSHQDVELDINELDAGLIFNNGASVAIVHNDNQMLSLISIDDKSVSRSIQLPCKKSPHSVMFPHPIVLAKIGAGIFFCGGDFLLDGTIFETSDASFPESSIWAISDVFPYSKAGSRITASFIMTTSIPSFVAGFDSGVVRLCSLSARFSVTEWKAHTSAITALSYIHSLVFCGSLIGEISVWKLDDLGYNQYPSSNELTVSFLAKFDLHFDCVLRFAKIGDLQVAAISQDKSFSLFKVHSSSYITQEMVGIGHTSLVTSFLYNSWVKDTKFVISVTQEGSIYIWITSTGALDRILKGKKAREFVQHHGFNVEARREPSLTTPHSTFSELVNICYSLNAKICTVDLVPLLDSLSAYMKASQSNRTAQWESSAPEPIQLLRSRAPSFSDEHFEDALRLVASLFVDWTLDPELDRQISERFDLFDPMQMISKNLLSHLCFAMFGTASVYKNSVAPLPFSITLLLPSRWPATSRWRFSHRCTALNSLCINALYMPLMSTGSIADQTLCSRLLANYGVLLPDALLFFKESALRVLAAFSLHNAESVHCSARLLLQSAITRMSFQKKSAAFSYWSSVFQGHAIRLEEVSEDRDYKHHDSFSKLDFVSRNDEKLMCAMIICFLCVNHRFSLDQEIGAALCSLLIHIITEKASDHVRASLAAELIGKGARYWLPFLSPLDRVLFQLLILSANEKGDSSDAVQLSARRALLEMSSVKPAEFFVVIAKVLHNHKKSSEILSISALECAADLVLKNPSSLLMDQDKRLIPAVVTMVINRLSLNESSARKAIFGPAMSVFRALSLKFAIVKVHSELQLIAFVSGRNIFIYDLISVSKCRVLDGHSAQIDAIAFNPNGSMMASYCAKENPPALRIWSLSKANRNFMAQWLSAPIVPSIQTIEFPSVEPGITVSECFQRITLSWTALGILLTREDRSIHQMSGYEIPST